MPYSRDTVFTVYNSTGVNSNFQIYRRTGKQLIVLNSRGYISTSTYSENGQTLKVTYQYDKSGYCIKESAFTAQIQIVTDFKYSGGNLVSLSSNTGSQVISEEMTYYLDKINTLNPNNSESFYNFGNECKNLMKTHHMSITGSHDITDSYTYEFDSNNYVTKRITTDDRGYISWDRYTYQK